ncbi:hypothetical protein B0H10DRAFT_536630 [Mycena sp. CBHHK59/15]|nr:hypothetical protein B0H10DRAFT_536630 [Mycena sp. CBHHK59/15]
MKLPSEWERICAPPYKSTRHLTFSNSDVASLREPDRFAVRRADVSRTKNFAPIRSSTLGLNVEFHDEKDYRKRGGPLPVRATGYENALRSIAACTTKFEDPRSCSCSRVWVRHVSSGACRAI